MPFPLRTRTRGRPSRNAGVVNVAAAPSFNPLTGWTTAPVHGVWASDPLWTPPADGGAVSSWRNGGSVGGDLVQATGSKQPTYRASTAAFNNKPTVQGDGVDDAIAATWSVAVAQPFTVVWIGSKSKAANASEVLFDDATSPVNAAVYTDTGASTWRMLSTFVLTGGTADTSSHLLVARYNGASSSLTVNGTSVLSGNIGAGSQQGLTLFSAVGGAAGYFSGGHVAMCAVFTTDPTALPEWATFKAWCLSFYGVTVA